MGGNKGWYGRLKSLIFVTRLLQRLLMAESVRTLPFPTLRYRLWLPGCRCAPARVRRNWPTCLASLLYRLPCAGVEPRHARCTKRCAAAEQVRRPACITITLSPPVSPPDPARMTCLGARLPQERVGFFILDVRKATKTLVVDVLLNVQIGTPCTEDAGVV